MSENTKIEWCDATVNFWAGCTKVSPACDHCYAEKMAGRLWGVKWGHGEQRKHFDGAMGTLSALDRKAKRLGHKLKVFINSLSDTFDRSVQDDDRADAFEAMACFENLTYLVLTKRIGNVAPFLAAHPEAAELFTSGRAWLGATVCNQAEADRDIPKLLAVPARMRFLSVEPMLGPVNLRLERLAQWNALAQEHGQPNAASALHWVICGGESGPNARPMHPDWARSLREQCAEAGVPFFMKQLGGARDKRGALGDFPEELRIREAPHG